jgi:predicted transcriptional regulator
VQRFMTNQPVTVPPYLSVQELLDQYVFRYYYKLYPVVTEGRLIGCVTFDRIREVDEAERGERQVSEILEPCSENNTIGADADAMEALSRMSRDQARLMVVDNGELRGIIALRDLLNFFTMKMDLGDDAEAGLADFRRGESAHREQARHVGHEAS